MVIPQDKHNYMIYFPSLNRAEQAIKDLKEAGFEIPYIDPFVANHPTGFLMESIHPDLSGGTLSDLIYNYVVLLVEPDNLDNMSKAKSIVEKHGGKI